MKLLFIRHGDPDYEIDSLTEKGWREAKLLSKRMMKERPDAIYCSPLGRARDTASFTLNALQKPATIYDWLREFDVPVTHPVTGEKRHIAWDLLPQYWCNCPELYEKDGWRQAELLHGSRVPQEYDRVCTGLDEVLEQHGYHREGNLYLAKHPNRDTVAVFCHFGVTCVMLSHLLGISPFVLWHHFVSAPTSVTVLYTEEREKGLASFRCQSFGDISHLYAGDEPPAFAARFCETYDCAEERH